MKIINNPWKQNHLHLKMFIFQLFSNSCFQVTCVESESDLSSTAKRFDAQFLAATVGKERGTPKPKNTDFDNPESESENSHSGPNTDTFNSKNSDSKTTKEDFVESKHAECESKYSKSVLKTNIFGFKNSDSVSKSINSESKNENSESKPESSNSESKNDHPKSETENFRLGNKFFSSKKTPILNRKIAKTQSKL
jgi:hypothetical protein